MANWYGTTTSNHPLITEGSEEQVQAILSRIGGGITAMVETNPEGESRIVIYGYDDVAAWDENYENDEIDDVYEKLQEFLEEPLVVSTVGAEKCRYVTAFAVIIPPDEEIQYVSLDQQIQETLDNL